MSPRSSKALSSQLRDECFSPPVPVRALLEAAATDDAVAEALRARNHRLFREERAAGEAKGRAAGLVEGEARGRAAGLVEGEARGRAAEAGFPLARGRSQARNP